MFKVEIIPSNSSQAQSARNDVCTSSPAKVLHACLASSSHHSDGILFSVGRKNADIVFENERSVSRSHCSLRLISRYGNTKAQTGQKSRGGKGENGKERKNVAGKAKTDEEIVACDGAEDGLAVVLHDLGRLVKTRCV